MKVDEVLERINEGRKARGEKIIAFDSLSTQEREDVFKIAKASEAKELTVSDVKAHIISMRKFVETKLTEEKMEKFSFWSFLFGWKQDYYLKARLRNYMLLEELLLSPETIRKHAEQQLGSIGGK
jgi:hypothetical protein